jgi:hypothetical protein
MKVVRWWIGLSVIGLVPLACGNSFSTVEPYKRSVSDVPYYLAEHTCYALADHCSSFLAELYFGPNDCVDLLTARFQAATLANLEDAVAIGTMKFDESKLDSCLSKIDALGCAALDNVYIPACESALGGTVDVDGSCAFDGECKGDAYCKYDGTCPGVCTQREFAGAVCRDDAECQPGDKCFGGKCTQKLAAGEACAKDDVGCRSGYVCGPDTGSGRKCVAVDSLFGNAAGAPCSIATASLCEQGSYCAITSVTVEEGAIQSCVEEAPSGSACTFSYPDMCPNSQYCDGTAITATPTPIIEGTCRLLPVHNEPCTGLTELGKACAENHVCVMTAEGAVCHKLQLNGKTCEVAADCYSDNCVGGVCMPKADCEVESEG